jgi:membrane associated rhomboid family serine protease
MRSPTPPTPSRPHRSQEIGAPAFLWVLVGAMALIELILSAADAGIVGSPGWRWGAYRVGAFWQPLLSGEVVPVFSGQSITMFGTYAFLHGGLMHLVLNSVVLLALGKFVSASIGPGRTLLVLLLASLGGGLAFGVISSSGLPMIGASGAVFGLIGVWQAWDFRKRRNAHRTLQPVVRSVLALAVGNVVLFVFLDGGLAWEAHLGGWLAGCVAAASFART